MREEVLPLLIEAIQDCTIVQLTYERQADGVVSIHRVAPIDVRPGETAKTAAVPYVWAWCFAEQKPETHLLSRVIRVQLLDESFDPNEVVAMWPNGPRAWPVPAEWHTPRDWPTLT